MNHIIAGHHDENVTTSILVAVAAQIFLPVFNIGSLFSATTAAATTAASSTATSSAVASVASFAGSRVLRANDRPLQVREAEAMAMSLLAAAGWDGREVSDQLQALRPAMQEEAEWTAELRESTLRIASLMQGPALVEDTPAVGVLSRVEPGLSLDLPPPVVSKPF